MASPPDHATRVYRIVSPRYPPFDGSGTHRWGSRWISPGQYVVHTAESYALAVLENLVHWQTSAVPKGLVSVAADIPHDIEQEELDRRHLPASRDSDYAPFREIGDDWYRRGETAVLWVPSLVSPVEANVLVNQMHEDFGKVVVHKPTPARVDPRLQRR
ncbi:MAG: RES family NAD+ phosphorylase [Gammaproteobacteria bacterium]|nr:RES family NAD+ phosphorylase [Gammaproteobacteria bacterium]MDE0367251.1 RES family NAD+ phosphorylase [Gammaproteobacteria bacterium]